MSGPTPYFHQSRAMGGAGPTPQTGFSTPPQSAIRSMVPDIGIGIGSGHHPFGSSFHMEHSLRPIMVSHGDGSADAGYRESEKKKRGRLRKFGLDRSGGGSASSAAHHRAVTPGSGSGSASGLGWSLLDPSQKRGRGRPPGSGKIQRLALLGESAVSTAGRGFT